MAEMYSITPNIFQIGQGIFELLSPYAIMVMYANEHNLC